MCAPADRPPPPLQGPGRHQKLAGHFPPGLEQQSTTVDDCWKIAPRTPPWNLDTREDGASAERAFPFLGPPVERPDLRPCDERLITFQAAIAKSKQSLNYQCDVRILLIARHEHITWSCNALVENLSTPTSGSLPREILPYNFEFVQPAQPACVKMPSLLGKSKT